ncbi:MAG TPA: glycosyltransferase, partial [Chitinophagaceae bacterium]|nr:glycosyltransferase [Chitinophagaceae bacterium]
MVNRQERYGFVLPVRNGGHYIKDCIESIRAQTIPEFTLFVLDNQSTDGTVDWIRSLNDPRIRILPAAASLTIEENWARIVGIHKTEFITLTGHDDWFHSRYLEVMEQLIDRHPDASLYFAHFHYIDAAGKKIRDCKPMAERITPRDFVSLFLNNMIESMGTGYFMRAADYDRAGGIPMYPNLLFADFELWFRLLQPTYMAVAFDDLFAFRLHQSTTTISSNQKFQAAFHRFIQFLKTLKQDKELDGAIQRYGVKFIAFYTKGLAHRLLRTAKSQRPEESVEKLGAICKTYADEL